MSRPAARLVATGSQTVGPFFHVGLTGSAARGVLVDRDTPGEQITLEIRVTDGNFDPVPDCLIEIWQADGEGRYDSSRFAGFGRLPTDADGTCRFTTVRPGRVNDGQGSWQAPHVHVRLFMRGLLRHLHTRAYFAGDPALNADAVLALVPADRRPTLLAQPPTPAGGVWRFDIRLQGERETVFFDL